MGVLGDSIVGNGVYVIKIIKVLLRNCSGISDDTSFDELWIGIT